MKICPRCSELQPDDAAFCPSDGETLAKATDPLLGRTIAARYRVTRRLGAGGMANVYLARHVIIDRLCAIKVLRQDLALNPANRERFLREARAVNRINHPNIVEITDYGEFEGMAYLVMEYVEGESLLAALKRGALSWPRVAHLGAQVASALGRAHQMGVIHRDLKPENVIVVGPPEKAGTRDETVKLTDFGIARIVDAPRLTFNEKMFGTPGYIAPECIEGMPADARADLYALGVVLYETMTGCLPYDARSQAERLVKALSSPPVPPRQRISGLPTELESLVLRLLARKPDERPRDAFAVVDALNDVLRRYAEFVECALLPLETAATRSSTASHRRPPKSSPTPPRARRAAVRAGGARAAGADRERRADAYGRDRDALVERAQRARGVHCRAIEGARGDVRLGSSVGARGGGARDGRARGAGAARRGGRAGEDGPARGRGARLPREPRARDRRARARSLARARSPRGAHVAPGEDGSGR